MKRNFCLLVIVLLSFQGFSQVKKLTQQKISSKQQQLFESDSLRNKQGNVKVLLSGQTKYTDYKVFSFLRDTTYIDTTLTIQKHYRFNFRRKDNFELLPFHNIGQTFNSLGVSFDQVKQFPDLGFRAKQFAYLDVEDINYYEVPTPTSEIMYMTTLEQGQYLESFFTVNFSERFNTSIAYTGLRSLGKYRRSLVSQGNFRTTFQYRTKQGQYSIRGHISSQDILNEENGGLTPSSLEAFETGDENFSDRARLDVNLTNAENLLEGTRLYVEQDYKLTASKDSVGQKDFSNLKIGHIYLSENKFYEFLQDAPSSIIGTPNIAGAIRDITKSSFNKNQFFLEFNSKYVLGTFRVKSSLMKHSYGYDEIFNQTSGITTRRLEGNGASFGADWKAKVKSLKLDASAEITPGKSRLSGTDFRGKLSYERDSTFAVNASLLVNSKSPNYNFLLHQSTYNEYNWFHNFENIRTQDLEIQLNSKWVNASVNLTNIENYTYFGQDSLPAQSGENVIYLKSKVSKELKYKKFALDNTIMYQNVSNASSVFRVPELVTRNTLYYSDYWFKGKPIYVQIGATFKYFTSYKANAYNPLIAEFQLQNDTDIGYPTLDVFFNAQVRRTRIYFRFDNLSSVFLRNNYFSAPNYPYRDAILRFGLIWNWFI